LWRRGEGNWGNCGFLNNWLGGGEWRGKVGWGVGGNVGKGDYLKGNISKGTKKSEKHREVRPALVSENRHLTQFLPEVDNWKVGT